MQDERSNEVQIVLADNSAWLALANSGVTKARRASLAKGPNNCHSSMR